MVLVCFILSQMLCKSLNVCNLEYLLNRKMMSNTNTQVAPVQVEGTSAQSAESTSVIQMRGKTDPVLLIKTHRVGKVYSRPHFFILNKGLNSGKPLRSSCPNCFVLVATDQDEKDFYFWLSFGLWKSKAYHPFLMGSVIEFLRIKDLKQILGREYKKAIQKREAFERAILFLINIDKYEMQLKNTLALLAVSKVQIFKSYQTT